MAFATTVGVMTDGSSTIPLHNVHQSAMAQEAHDWAKKLQHEFSHIENYSDIESVPSSITIDEAILSAPRAKAANPAHAKLAEQIANIMYPALANTSSPMAATTQYEKDLVKLRKLVILQRKRMIDSNTKRNEQMTWAFRILKQGPWDPVSDPVFLSDKISLPMPVEIADASTLEPFFAHLASGGTDARSSTIHAETDGVQIFESAYDTPAIEFERGVTYSDRRMDLCKMVVGPNNIAALMESLRTNEFIEHFLLGNNIIGPYGARCIAYFLKEFPDRMDTWYLAGNCIDAPSFGLLVDQWVKSSKVTNIWLKRNPLGREATADVFRLITLTKNLRTLDLDQTSLGDEGIAELFTSLAVHERPITLRNLYLDAIGIGAKGAAAIAKYLASPQCQLHALYLTNNPLGNEGVVALSSGLKANRSLARLTMASVGVSDEGIIVLCSALEDNPTLVTLDIGQSYATEDLGTRYNYLTDRSAFAIHNLILTTPNLTYLNLTQTALTNTGLTTILEAATNSSKLQFYRASTIHPQLRDPAAIRAGQVHAKLAEHMQSVLLRNIKLAYGEDVTHDTFMNEHRRWLVSDRTDVRKIDSVYRNRDAGLARRGVKKLEKLWEDGDETIGEVMGAVGPVCVKRKQRVEV